MLYPISKVTALTTLSKSTIYRLIKTGSFPRPVRLSRMRVAWRQTDIEAFMAACPDNGGAV
jgi:prophage regulatory protein